MKKHNCKQEELSSSFSDRIKWLFSQICLLNIIMKNDVLSSRQYALRNICILFVHIKVVLQKDQMFISLENCGCYTWSPQHLIMKMVFCFGISWLWLGILCVHKWICICVCVYKIHKYFPLHPEAFSENTNSNQWN